MKKLFILLAAMSFGLSITLVNAQTPQQGTQATTGARSTKGAKPNTSYKANKAKEENASSPEAVPAGPKKKDGSVDMRYKANKGKGKTTVKPIR